MILISDKIAGLIIMILWSVSGAIFLLSPGSLKIEKPRGGLLSWLYNILHLVYELILIPAAGILFLIERSNIFETFQINISKPSLLIIQPAGIILLFAGVGLLSWARIIMKKSFRIAAVMPGPEDTLFTNGPFKLVRNPMYTSVLCNCIGLTLLTRVYIFSILFFLFLMLLIFVIIPSEEKNLEIAYKNDYMRYKKESKRLIPFIY
ncbi:MAG: isoprenylcysteine carboxylmethyltransferase family protein [Spirochaetes bacterium]|jgi:protein-S-isoprenylcysteine O-methyltransferase Ste14|nr:isoprenylcysteine carboxylmethyltransferase family protein [Spirochaetota bacterium]